MEADGNAKSGPQWRAAIVITSAIRAFGVRRLTKTLLRRTGSGLGKSTARAKGGTPRSAAWSSAHRKVRPVALAMDEVKDLAEEEDREWEMNLARETQAAASGRVTTEVKKSADAKRVDYARQGNKWWLTDQGIRERRALKFSEGVSAYIRDIWALLPKNDRKKVEKDTYCAFCRAVAKILTGGGAYDPEEDWRADSHGLGPMAFGLFYDAVFQLVDLWTETSLEADYQDFLRNLVKHLEKHLGARSARPRKKAKKAKSKPATATVEVPPPRTPSKAAAPAPEAAAPQGSPTSVLDPLGATGPLPGVGDAMCAVCGQDDDGAGREAALQCPDCQCSFHAECVGGAHSHAAAGPHGHGHGHAAAGGAWQCPECTDKRTADAGCGVCGEEEGCSGNGPESTACPECHARFHAECLGLAPEDAAGGAAFACPQCAPPGKAELTIDVAGAPDADGYFQVEIGVTAHEAVAEGLLEVAGSDDLEIDGGAEIAGMAAGSSRVVRCRGRFREAGRRLIHARLICKGRGDDGAGKDGAGKAGAGKDGAGAGDGGEEDTVARTAVPVACDPATGGARVVKRQHKQRRGRGKAKTGRRRAGPKARTSGTDADGGAARHQNRRSPRGKAADAGRGGGNRKTAGSVADGGHGGGTSTQETGESAPGGARPDSRPDSARESGRRRKGPADGAEAAGKGGRSDRDGRAGAGRPRLDDGYEANPYEDPRPDPGRGEGWEYWGQSKDERLGSLGRDGPGAQAFVEEPQVMRSRLLKEIYNAESRYKDLFSAAPGGAKPRKKGENNNRSRGPRPKPRGGYRVNRATRPKSRARPASRYKTPSGTRFQIRQTEFEFGSGFNGAGPARVARSELYLAELRQRERAKQRRRQRPAPQLSLSTFSGSLTLAEYASYGASYGASSEPHFGGGGRPKSRSALRSALGSRSRSRLGSRLGSRRGLRAASRSKSRRGQRPGTGHLSSRGGSVSRAGVEKPHAPRKHAPKTLLDLRPTRGAFRPKSRKKRAGDKVRQIKFFDEGEEMQKERAAAAQRHSRPHAVGFGGHTRATVTLPVIERRTTAAEPRTSATWAPGAVRHAVSVPLIRQEQDRHKARWPARGPIFSPVPALGYSPPVAARPPKLPPLTSAGKGMLKVRNIGQDLKF